MSLYSYRSESRNPIISILIAVVTIAAIYFALKGLFWVLQWAAPVFLVATLILDSSVVIDYFKWLGALVQRSPLSGIVMGALSIVAYPIVAVFLFFKALIKRRLKKMMDAHQQPQYENRNIPQDEYIDYEEIKEEPIQQRGKTIKLRKDSDQDFV